MLSDLNIGTAWQHVKSNKGAPGIDNMKIDEFNAFAVQHWQGIKSKILDETYQPLPVKRVRIPKSDGGERFPGIPSVIDRMIQQAISQVITPYFEPLFSSHSYGYRPGKRASQAVSYVQSCVKQGFKTAVDLDAWIRRRLRMCYWRQWRKPRTKVRSLIKLGVSEYLAISCGITSKGPCRNSKTKGINIAINNDFLAKQGLVSLRDVWIKIHYGR